MHSEKGKKQIGRPRSLKEVALFGDERGDMDSFLREFLDEFYVEQDGLAREAMLREEPPFVEADRTNAYLAAVAEHLAFRNHLAVPAWAGQARRFLKRPYFPAGLESLKATMLVSSPSAFRRRMIFVDADPLYRPRRDAIGIGNAQAAGALEGGAAIVAREASASDVVDADVVTDGFHSGKILDVEDGVVIQKTGRGGKVAKHLLSKLSVPVVIGEVVEIE